MRKSVMALLIVGSVVALFSSNADAGSANFTLWSSNGAGCVPTNTAIQSNLYTVAAGAVTGGASTTVVLYCPVHTLWDAQATTIGMTYKGTRTVIAPFSSAKAELIAMNISTGVETVISTLNSTSSSVVNHVGTSYTHTFDYDTNYYYVKVTIASGTSGTSIQTLYGVSLGYSP